jgi:hypothetical protein
MAEESGDPRKPQISVCDIGALCGAGADAERRASKPSCRSDELGQRRSSSILRASGPQGLRASGDAENERVRTGHESRSHLIALASPFRPAERSRTQRAGRRFQNVDRSGGHQVPGLPGNEGMERVTRGYMPLRSSMRRTHRRRARYFVRTSCQVPVFPSSFSEAHSEEAVAVSTPGSWGMLSELEPAPTRISAMEHQTHAVHARAALAWQSLGEHPRASRR